MLYIMQDDENLTKSWHVGEPLNCAIRRVIEIQADGDELILIRSLFHRDGVTGTTIPFTSQPVQNWFGDIAKTIAQALLHKSKAHVRKS